MAENNVSETGNKTIPFLTTIILHFAVHFAVTSNICCPENVEMSLLVFLDPDLGG